MAGVGLVIATGCGAKQFPTTRVTGVVLCQGAPVEVGQLSFSPIPKSGQITSGKTAVATVEAGGRFTLGTFSAADGAIVGRHRVMYFDPDGRPGKSPCGPLATLEIEITSGMEPLTIELSEARKQSSTSAGR